MSDKVIVTCALSGSAANRQQCPAIPFSPEEFAEEAYRAREAGASVVHVHARKPHDGVPTDDAYDAKAILDAICARVPDVVVDLATSPATPARDRVTTIREVQPEVASVQAGSMNYALRRDGKFVLDAVVANPFEDMRTLLEAMLSSGSKPNHECFDLGHVHNVELLGAAGADPLYTFVLGVQGATAATTENLVHLVRTLPPGATWQAAGVRHPEQWWMTAAALSMGGSVRVGLEDNFYVDDGVMATSNGELVDKAVRLARELGREVADPSQTRAILRLMVPERAKTRAEAPG